MTVIRLAFSLLWVLIVRLCITDMFEIAKSKHLLEVVDVMY